MRRGDLYRKRRPEGDPKKFRVYVIVSRQALIDSKYSTVNCAPVYTTGQGLSTQVAVGPEEGLKHPSWIICDNLVSVNKSELKDFIGSLPTSKLAELNHALKAALDVL